MSDKLALEEYRKPWSSLVFCGEKLGIIKVVNDGYLAIGKRKPVATLEEAAKQILDRKMNACMSEHEKHRKLLGRVLSC